MHRSARNRRPTFSQILESTREASAARVWDKAKAVSTLRHLVQSSRRARGAAVLAEAKRALVRRAVELVPDQIKVGIDSDYQVGLLSIRWHGHGRMHLPAGTDLPASRQGTPATV